MTSATEPTTTGPGQSSIAAGDGRGRVPTVLQVLPRLDGGGGVERGTMEISRALVRAGWRSIIVSATETSSGFIGGADLAHGHTGARHVTLPVASKNPLIARATSAQLAALIEEEGVDIVHARSRAPAWIAYGAARRTGRRFMTTFHGTYRAGNPLKKRYNAIMTRGARIIAISEFIAHHVAEEYGVGPERVRIVPRGVDLEIFDPAKVSAERIIGLATQWRVPDDRPIIMLPGRLTHWKGQDVMIDALAQLGRDDVYCLLVGGGHGREAYRRRIERQIEQNGLGAQVRLTGTCRDMPAAYMLADVVISASVRPEAFGRVVVEAQAMGRPVVASDHGGAKETIVPGETGWLVPPGDAAATRDAVETAVALAPEARDRMARAAQAHIRQNYSLASMCETTLGVYRELLEEDGDAAIERGGAP